MVRYYPPPGDWKRSEPLDVDADPECIAEAVEYAENNETQTPKDRSNHYSRHVERLIDHAEQRYGDEEELAREIGPVKKPRGDPAGVIIHQGRIIGEWGDPTEVDAVNSVSKSFISTVAGVAYDQGLIENLDDFVKDDIISGKFRYSHNNRITWHHLLELTSEWEGEMFGKPDIADRRRGRERELQEPGTFWEYNNVRVNLIAHSLLHLFREPLPNVLERQIMDPIGASSSWQWHGYDNSDTLIDDRTNSQKYKSVAGGGHWGGGVWMSALDLARWGYLYQCNGEWDGTQLLSPEWIEQATTPCEHQPKYGYLWWLNTNKEALPDAPEETYMAVGHGHNLIWVDPVHDVTAVLRQFAPRPDRELGELHRLNDFCQLVIDAVE